jgi:hypothetical protein
MKRLYLFVIFGMFVIAACNTTSQTTSPMHVKVIDGQGKGIANATVVIGNQAGTMESFLSTDALGSAHFDSAPSNATVTAAFSCYDPSTNRTYYSVDIAYGVNVSAVTLTLGTCDGTVQGSVDVRVTDQVAGITSHDVTLGPITYGGSSVTMDFNGSVQDDGNISVFAGGYDDAGNIKGYGIALDRPAVDGSVIDIVIDRTDLVRHTHRFGNVPSNTIEYFAYASLLRKRAATNLPLNFTWGAAPLPETFATYSSGSFADNNLFSAAVGLDSDSDGNADATVGMARCRRNASDQLFDFSLTPLLPGNLTFNPGTAGRPVISWSNNDSRSTVQTLTLSRRSNTPQRVSFSYSMTAPASATGLVFPELPDELAAFRPGAYDNLSLNTTKFDSPTSYEDYLKALPGFNGYCYGEAGLSSYSYARISRLP